MRAVKQFGFKLIVVLCIVSTFFCFVATMPVNAASKVKSDEFYYSGTTKGTYTVNKNLLERLIELLGAILDYLLGIMTMGFRIIFIGWTALLERCLTWILEGVTGESINIDREIDANSLINSADYITVEAIVFNHVPLFNIDVFDFEDDKKYDALGQEIEKDETASTGTTSSDDDDSFLMIMKKTIAGWYYTFRLISIMIMLVLLIYIGFKLAVATTSKGKALYKKVLMDWLTGMILVFFIHYFILAMIYFNDVLVTEISKMSLGHKELEVYEYGIKERADKGVSDAEMEVSVYDEVRTRSMDAKLTVGTTGMIMYMFLVYYAYKFSFLYLKRYLVVATLIMMAPFIAVMYAFNKVKSGKAVVFWNWFKELFFMIILQSIHALLYIIFFQEALAISLTSIGGIIVAFVMLHFMTKAEEIFRKIFNIQGNLTNETAGSKLSDIKKSVTAASMGVAGSKLAIGMTQTSARILTKPIRAGLNAGFGKIMEKRAEKLNKKKETIEKNNKEREEKIKRNQEIQARNDEKLARNAERIERNKQLRKQGLPTEKLETLEKLEDVDEFELTDEEKYKADELTRQNQLDLGTLAKNLPKDKSQLTKEQRKELLALKAKIPMESKKNPGQPMDDDEYIDEFYKNKESHAKKFDEITSLRATLIHDAKVMKHDILNPFQYVDKDKDGKYRRIKTEREHENWGPILKHLSKKKDGTSVVLSKYMNTDYLFGYDKNTKEALKKQADFIKAELIGFSGILLGLPLVVAEPAIGAAFLAKGISASKQVFGGHNSAKRKNLKNVYMTADGKYHLVGYAGKSVQTIANGMQQAALENINDVEEGREAHNREVVGRTRKHRKLYSAIKGTFKVGAGASATYGALDSIATMPAIPAVGCVAGVAAGAVLTGHLLGNFGTNAYMAMHDTIRAGRKKSAKDWEEQVKSTDAMLDYFADKYFEVEEQKKELKVQETAILFESAYKQALNQEIQTVNQDVEEMSDDRLILESDYDEEIKVQIADDGKKQISSTAEKKVIDKAIVEIVQKSGIINLEDFDLGSGDRMAYAKKVITDMLIQQGVISRGQTADDIIDNLDSKILGQKSELEKTNITAVQDKMVDDSIIEVMREKGIQDISSVRTEDVMERFNQKCQQMANGTTEQSSSVINSINNGKGENASSGESAEPKVVIGAANVQARKSIMSSNVSKAKEELTAREKQQIKDSLKKKKISEFDAQILINQEQIESNSSTNTSGVSSSNTDDVLKMLDLQTKLHKDKKELETVSSYVTSGNKKKKRQSYLAGSLLFNTDGSVRVNQFSDGSRRVVENPRATTVSSSDLSVLEIMRKVKSENNI